MEKKTNALTTTETTERQATLADLIKKTNRENPAPEDLERLRRKFDEVPQIYRNVGNSGNVIIEQILDNFCGGSAFVREATLRYMAEMKAELGFDSSSFVEKMLINEILMRWLRLQVTESDHKKATYCAHTFDEGIYKDKRLDVAQKRYLRAIETLAKVRRMISDTQLKSAKMFSNLLEPEKKNRSSKLIDEPATFNEKPDV